MEGTSSSLIDDSPSHILEGTVRPSVPAERPEPGLDSTQASWEANAAADAARAEEYLDVLEEYRVTSERQGRYAEAGRTLDQIGKVRAEEEARRISSLAA